MFLPTERYYFNGLAFRVSEKELAELDQRESHYQRDEVSIFDFDTGKLIRKAFVYSAPYGFEAVTRDAKYLPEWEDIAFARTGAYRYGKKFGEMNDRTTYLADGVTLAVDYYKDHLPELILDK